MAHIFPGIQGAIIPLGLASTLLFHGPTKATGEWCEVRSSRKPEDADAAPASASRSLLPVLCAKWSPARRDRYEKKTLYWAETCIKSTRRPLASSNTHWWLTTCPSAKRLKINQGKAARWDCSARCAGMRRALTFLNSRGQESVTQPCPPPHSSRSWTARPARSQGRNILHSGPFRTSRLKAG